MELASTKDGFLRDCEAVINTLALPSTKDGFLRDCEVFESHGICTGYRPSTKDGFLRDCESPSMWLSHSAPSTKDGFLRHCEHGVNEIFAWNSKTVNQGRVSEGLRFGDWPGWRP